MVITFHFIDDRQELYEEILEMTENHKYLVGAAALGEGKCGEAGRKALET